MSLHMIKYPGINLGPHHGEDHDKAETVVFGFWVYLMSDLIIFGLMFATYLTMVNPMSMAGGPEPAEVFNLTSAFAQTMLLLTSSATFGFASLAMRHNHTASKLTLWLTVTLCLGVLFLLFELNDLAHMLSIGAGPSRSGYLSAFFGLIPLHGLHVAFGCLWLAIMLVQIRTLGMVPIVKSRLLRLGMFWHFLDIIWVGIFSIVYLPGLYP